MVLTKNLNTVFTHILFDKFNSVRSFSRNNIKFFSGKIDLTVFLSYFFPVDILFWFTYLGYIVKLINYLLLGLRDNNGTNNWVLIFELGSCGIKLQILRLSGARSSLKFSIECRFTLERVRGMIITYCQIRLRLF